MISASLLGALAGNAARPRKSYEQTIPSGRCIRASLTAFAGAFERARGGVASAARPNVPGVLRDHAGALARRVRPTRRGCRIRRRQGDRPGGLLNGWKALTARVDDCPSHRDMASRGQKKVVDYQASPTEEYPTVSAAVALDGWASLSPVRRRSQASPTPCAMTTLIRVADLKTRSTRGARVRREGRHEGDAVQVTEYFHPYIENSGAMPARLGRYIETGQSSRASRPPHQSRPPHPHRQLCRLCNAVAGRRHASLAPRPVRHQVDGASGTLVPAG